MDWFGLTTQFGLPLVMFFGVIYLSLTGKIVWKLSHDAEIKTLRDSCDERIREKGETIEWLKGELRTSLRTTERATTAAEVATGVAKKVTDS